MMPHQFELLRCQAVQPVLKLYYVFYSTPRQIGWNVVTFWSYNRLEIAKDEFLTEFWDERPQIISMSCQEEN